MNIQRIRKRVGVSARLQRFAEFLSNEINLIETGGVSVRVLKAQFHRDRATVKRLQKY